MQKSKMKLLPVIISVLMFFGALSVYSYATAVNAHAAEKKYKITISVNMGKQGSSCPVLYFDRDGKTEELAYGMSWYIGDKKVDDPFTKSKAWYKKHNIKVVMTSVRLPAGTYKVSCDNGVKKKIVIADLKVTKNNKKTVRF